MRPAPPPLFPSGAAIAALLVLANCQNKETASSPPPLPPTQGVEGFFNPQVNESWTYAGTRDFPPGTHLGAGDAGQTTTLPGGAERLPFMRRRVCTGLYRPEGSDRELTTFDIYEDGTLTERELYDITPGGVIGRGWAPAGIPFSNGALLTPGVKIASPGMAGGHSWSVSSGDSGRVFKLQVIERTEITVPAGTFEAARLRITVTGDERSTKRTVWFAENIGIVKEEVIHYGPNHIRAREQLDLVRWTLPSLAHHADPAPPQDPVDTSPLPLPTGYTQINTTPVPPPAPEDDAPGDPGTGNEYLEEEEDFIGPRNKLPFPEPADNNMEPHPKDPKDPKDSDRES